ncbi:hypothetical protein JTB14_027048 [Gonioctena quinquepunctata]|nr:hypothetical protein JTB14_027048 [Gonioctena quinquepunctata]
MFHSLGNKPRPCILLRKDINGLLLPDFCSVDVVAAQLTIPTEEEQMELTVCSAYFAGDIEAENPLTLVKSLVRHCRRNSIKLIAGRDANTHHTVWVGGGGIIINHRGDQLVELILGLIVQNIVSEPTFVASN